MWPQKLLQETILCLILQVLLIWIILGIYFDHDIWQALLESLVTQIITTIAGIIFIVMMFNKQ